MMAPGEVIHPAWLAGFGLSLSLIVAIGAQNILVLRQGLRREHVLAVVFICTALDAILMGTGIAGVASALGDHPKALRAIGLLGAVVLGAYGTHALWRAVYPRPLEANATQAVTSLRQVISQTLAISLLNPHVYLDTVVLVGSVGAQQPSGDQLVFWLGAVCASALWFNTLGWGARIMAPVFQRPSAWRWLDLSVALLMFSLAWGLWKNG